MKRTILSLAIAAAACSWAAAATLGDDVRIADNRVVYEVFVRNFSSSGRLAEVTRQLPRLKDLGVDVVWLMPIQKGGDKNRWGTYSSPYAIKDYYLIDPLHGTDDDMRTLVQTAHSLGLEVWLDWVANHTSTDNVWTVSHPEYYGSSFKNPMGWTDVYQLDYSKTATRTAMIDAMRYWVETFDIDGFRCDYADGVPVSFWREARTAIDKVKPLTWLAESAGEGNNVQLVSQVFDYNYAWKFNDDLIAAGTGQSIADNVSDAAYLLYNCRDAAQYAGKSRMVYLSNHDVVQDKKGTPDRHFGDNLKPMTVFEFTAYGMPLIYNGQEINWSTGQVLLAERSPINWNKADAEITDLITDLCRLKHSYPVLAAGDRGGEYIRHTPVSTTGAGSKILVYERRLGTESLVVMLNFSASEETFAVSTLPGGRYTEFFLGNTVDFSSTHRFTLPAKGYAVWTRTDDTAIEPFTHTLYVEDTTGWSSLNVYGWASGNYAEIFGSWPGAKPTGTATLSDGVTYKTFEVQPAQWGHTYNLIFNASSTQAPDYACRLDGDAVIRLTASGATAKSLPAELRQPTYDEETPWVWDNSGVETVMPDPPVKYDPTLPADYYTLGGTLVATGTVSNRSLQPGIYIVRQGCHIHKLWIRP